MGELLQGTTEVVEQAARRRIETAGPGGGYILSTACSVPPRTPPENVALLREVAESAGTYPLPDVDLAAIAVQTAPSVDGKAARRPDRRRNLRERHLGGDASDR